MATLDEDLDAQLASKTEDPDFADVDVTVNGTLRTLRFWQMDGLEWADLAAQCPPNLKSSLDTAYGYSLRAMTLLAAPKSGKLVDGDTPTPLTDEQWTKLFRSLPGSSHRDVANALYSLNEWLPSQAVVEAKKASRAKSAPTSPQPAPSESPTAGSSDENQLSEPDTSTTPTDASPEL